MTYRELLYILFCTANAVIIKEIDLSMHSYLALVVSYDPKGELTGLCNGCIISNRLLLTVAHCYRPEDNSEAVLVGGNTENFMFNIEKWIIHPHFLYSGDTTYNDFALVRTKREMNLENIVPIQFQPLPPMSYIHSMSCKMFGWRIEDLDFVGSTLSAVNVTTVGMTLKRVFSLDKKLLSFTQCKALIDLTPEVIYMDDSFLCVRHNLDFLEEPNFGLLGSPLLCRTDVILDRWTLVGLKRKQRNIGVKTPELFMNIHVFRNYFHFVVEHPDQPPKIYFCEILVCGEKYSVYGEYCVFGDEADCFHKNLIIKYFFPSVANSKCLSTTLIWFLFLVYNC